MTGNPDADRVMTAPTGALPCVGNAALYDTVLYEDDASATEWATARGQAAALCASCPAPCPDKVTQHTTPRTLVLLNSDWMPPTTEGHPDPTQTATPRRGRRPRIVTGLEYIKPRQRPAAWARMAADLAREGRSLPDIALALCVDERTALALVDLAQQGRETVA